MFGSSAEEESSEDYASASDSEPEDNYADPVNLDGHNYPPWVKDTIGRKLQVSILHASMS